MGDRYCPDHGSPQPGREWPCPVAVEGGPPETQTCHHFLGEMDRRIARVRAGDYWQLDPERGPDGEMTFHEYKNHQKTGRTRTFTLHPDTANDQE